MSLKRLLVAAGLSILLAGCSTEYAGDDPFLVFNKEDSKTLGVRYLLGRGVKQNNDRAFYYFNRAADDGDPFAQNELAYLYAAGKGTKRDYHQSFYWYQKAAQQGLASAQYNLSIMYARGLGTPVNQAKANEWLHKSAAHGFQPAVAALKKA